MVREKTSDGKLRSSHLVEEILDFINQCEIYGLVDLHNGIFDRNIQVDQIAIDGNEGKRK